MQGGTLAGGAGNDVLTKADSYAWTYWPQWRYDSYAGYYNTAATFNGGAGNDRLVGGAEADTYLFNRGDGSDTINDYDGSMFGRADKIVFGAGIAQSDLTLSRSGGNLVIKIADPANAAATDQITIENWDSGTYRIEQVQFADGNSLTGTQLGQMAGTAGNDNINGSAYGDVLFGLDGNDVINGNAGNDILQGGAGNDTLVNTAGINLLDGGLGDDTLAGGAGNEFFSGGAGNDTITTGNGADVIAFNRGNGQDILNGGIGTDNALSLGGGIQYSDLALSKTGNDLILEVGGNEQITLKNWYDTTVNYKSVLTLQMVADAMASFDPASADPLLNKAIQEFDFTAIANAFDQARGTSATFMHWSATNALLAAHLSSSDTAAIGGDLAHQYGMNGTFAGMNLTAAQSVLSGPQFGVQPQALQPLQGLQGGSVTLAA